MSWLHFWAVALVVLMMLARRSRRRPEPEDSVRLVGLDGACFPLLSLVAEARITGCFADVVVRQRFGNRRRRPVEAIYVFPLPGRASVCDFRLTTAGRTLCGRVAERQQARQVYREAVGAGQQAALLEQERDNVFTLSVGNLPPGQEVTVELRYVERLEMSGGETEFRFPVVVGERYTPQARQAWQVTPPRVAADPFDFRLTLWLNTAGRVIRKLWVGQHPVDQQLTAHDLRLQVSAGLHQEFVLRYALATQPGAGLLQTHGQHFLLSVFPPALPSAPRPRDVVFLVDRSGSMKGENEGAARLAMERFLNELGDEDRFAILAYDHRVEQFAPDWTPATSRGSGRDYVRGLQARGGTEIGRALRQALGLHREPGRAVCIMLITDGEVNNEAALYRDVQRGLGEWRIFTLGIDRNVNEAFLRRLARLGRGTCELVLPGQDMTAALQRLVSELGAPAVTGLQVEGGVTDLVPAPLPPLFGERPTVVLGRLDGSGPVTITGDPGFDLTLEPIPVDQDLARLWARERILELEDAMRLGQYTRQELLELSLRYNLVSSLTSFVVVDEARSVVEPCLRLVQPVRVQAAVSSQVRQMSIDCDLHEHRSHSVVQLWLEDPICVEVGRALLSLVDHNQRHELLTRIGELRAQLHTELGFPIPGVRCRDNRTLAPCAYLITIKSLEVGGGEVFPGHLLALAEETTLEQLGGTPAVEPVYGRPARWISAGDRDRAEQLGCFILECADVIASHLAECARRHAGDLLDRAMVSALRLPPAVGLGTAHRVLQKLLEEGLCLTDGTAIRAALAEGPDEVGPLLERLRQVLSGQVLSGQPHTEAARRRTSAGSWAPT